MNDSLDLGLKDKVAIVAGGGAAGNGIGNGRAAAILLAEAGVKVLIADRDQELADNTVNMITKRGGVALSIDGDLTKSNDCIKVVDFAMSKWRRLDILDICILIGIYVIVIYTPQWPRQVYCFLFTVIWTKTN